MSEAVSGAAVLRVCATCAPETVAQCSRIVTEAGLADQVAVRGQDCLNRCSAPVALALQGAGRVSYVFDGVDLETDASDLAATLRTYLAAPQGWIADARPCGRLRHRLCTRLLPPET